LPGALPPLAQPSFATGPQDNLATANAYTTNGGIITSIQTQLATLGIDVPDILKGGAALAAVLPIVSGIVQAAESGNITALTSRLLSGASTITSAFASLDPTLAQVILAGISTVAPIAVTIAGVTTELSSAIYSTQAAATESLNSLTQLGALLTSFTNGAAGFSITDGGVTASVAGNLSGSLSSLGVPNAYAAATTGITDISTLSVAASAALPSAISSMDLQSITTIANTIGSGQLNLINPSIVSEIAQGFTRTSMVSGTVGSVATTIGASSAANDSETFTQLINTFTAVNPSWNSCTRGTTSSGDISALMGCTGDFSSVLVNGVQEATAGPVQDSVLAALYSPTSVVNALSTSFPNTALVTGNSAPSNIQSPTSGASGLLDSITAAMPTMSLASGTATTQQQTASMSQSMVPIAPGAYNPTAYGFPLASSPASSLVTTTPTAATFSAATPTPSGPMLKTVYGTLVSSSSHSIVGYTQQGQVVYSDDDNLMVLGRYCQAGEPYLVVQAMNASLLPWPPS
jgi:hypothetical protein